ncbi:hypothetical protein AC1031_009171 [Aphanomyces cochlioides]|nr:hypothetical protein AC1031_009171 [Aphanomyces cochlioides]
MPMARFSDEDEAVLAKDRAEHPECTHSTTISSSCRSVNGDRQCEILRRIFRNCPGRRRELILDTKDQTDDTNASMNDAFGGDDFPDPFQIFRGVLDRDDAQSPFRGGFSGPHPFEKMDDIMQEMLRPFGFGMFGSPFDSDEGPVPFEYRGDKVPPHRGYAKRGGNHGKKEPRKKDLFDGFEGRVEEI